MYNVYLIVWIQNVHVNDWNFLFPLLPGIQSAEAGELSRSEIQELINIANEVAEHTRQGRHQLEFVIFSP